MRFVVFEGASGVALLTSKSVDLDLKINLDISFFQYVKVCVCRNDILLV
jgi:hypothetical protein